MTHICGRSVTHQPLRCTASCSNRCLPATSCLPPSTRWWPGLPLQRRTHSNARCRAAEQDIKVTTTASTEVKTTGEGEERIKQTLADLDALLGLEAEPKDKPKDVQGQDAPKLDVSVSPEAMKQIAAADSTRVPAAGDQLEQGLSDQMSKIVEQAKRIATEQDNSAGEQALRKEFDTLLNLLKPGDTVPKEDIKIIKEEVLKPLNFWVTEATISTEQDGGLLVRGNLRGNMTELFAAVDARLKERFGDKYILLMVEDTEASQLTEGPSEPRPAFQFIPSALAQPRPTAGWQIVAALVLLGLTVASSLQVGLVANLNKLPKETLEWLARPENMNSDVLPPGLETWDPLPYISTAIPISVGVFGIALLRELGQRLAAAAKDIKLGPAYFIPNGQIGSFGSSTPLKSFIKNRSDLFDLAFAGVAMGGGAAFTLFLAGLIMTQSGELPPDMLVPIPSALFQGSLLLGLITKAGLGEAALRGATVYVHPYLIAGWCGLVGTALNCLPVGSIDGGRFTQAAYGRGTLSVSGFFTYIGLGLGFLGSALSLPFGLYVLICQRTAEKYVQDNLSPISDPRKVAASVLIFTAILILLPMAPEVADVTGIGPQSWSL